VSLIEVLVGIAIMVPLTLASVTGLMVEIKASAAAQQRQQLEVVLATATEDLKTLPYLQCGTVEEYQALFAEWSRPFAAKLIPSEQPQAASVTSVDYWNRGKQSYASSCGGDDGTQRLTVTVTGRDMSVAGSVVKRDDDARVGNSG
jgi:hypothetical protein